MSLLGILGAGAWGTALAVAGRRAGHSVRLWAHDPAVVAEIGGRRENETYLPGVPVDDGVAATSRLEDLVDCGIILLAPPSQHLREIAVAMQPLWPQGVPAVICSKGIEERTGAMMTEVVAAALPGVPQAVLSGPNFAGEVARNLPAAATLASTDADLAERLAGDLSSRRFRLYASDDPVGVQVGGAVKNVIAIAAGIVVGRSLGENAKAALITRGLAETARLARALGARPQTLMGLAGLGDLTLTCSAVQSRNFSLGIALGKGRALAEVMRERRSVAEGVWTARSVTELAGWRGVDMPLCAAVSRVLHEGADLDMEIEGLLTRPLRTED